MVGRDFRGLPRPGNSGPPEQHCTQAPRPGRFCALILARTEACQFPRDEALTLHAVPQPQCNIKPSMQRYCPCCACQHEGLARLLSVVEAVKKDWSYMAHLVGGKHAQEIY